MRRLAFGLLLAAAASPLGLASSFQDGVAPVAAPEVDAETAKSIETYLGHARTGSAIIRPQAAQRLVRLGEPAAARILEVTGKTNAQLALLGTDLIEIFGAFKDSPSGDKLRARLWPALEDPEFPWRPAASRGLSFQPKPAEKELFVRYLDDPIAPVRLAVLDALYGLTRDAKGEERASYLQHAFARLSDENDVVRREAALQLDARGHGNAFLWLLEDMRRDDSFFGMPTGQAARYAAMNALMDRNIDLGTFNPELPPSLEMNRDGLEALEAKLKVRAKAMNAALPKEERDLLAAGPPPIARAAPRIEGAVIGLQLKSCRRGDFYLRWREDDVLVVGFGNPALIQLETGTTKALVEAAKKAQAPIGDQVFWGRPGCDVEGYFVPRAANDDGTPLQLIIAKNEGMVEDLRPATLSGFGAALAASIPTGDDLASSDPRTRELAARIRGAFKSIGGPLAK